jgi:STE24 endopeptidase
VYGPILLALGSAELGVRLLRPRHRLAEPESVDLRAYFSEEEIARGARFARPQLALALARSALEGAALVALVRRPSVIAERLPSRLAGWPARHRKRGSGVSLTPALEGAVTAAALTTALSLPPLPLAAVARRRAIKVGLVTQSWRGWAVDLIKANAIQAVLAAGGGAAVVSLTRRYPRGWWAPAAGGSVVFGALLAAVAPVVLDPIFNDFTPLPEGETREDVLALAEAAGVEVREVYSIDASRRTTAANAYVTGLGPTKRVVLFDTLLDRYSREEVRVVVAHELAHVSGRDVPRGVLYAALVAPAGAFAVQRMSWELSSERGSATALPALALAGALVSVPLGMIGNRLSRAMERRADQVSLELTDGADAFVSFERTIALQNVADLDPPRWVTRLLSTHPSTAERIGAALGYGAED